MTPLRIALLGVGNSGQQWLEALRASPGFRLAALCGHESSVGEPLAAACEVPFYNDYRLVLVEQKPDAALFAVPPFVAEAYLPVAAQHGIAVLQETPFARGFEEAVRLIGCFYDAEVPLVVASRWRFDREIAAALVETASNGGFHLAQATRCAPVPDLQQWRGDSRRAGGGVLRDAAYELVDMVVDALGLPGDVTAQLGRCSAAAGERFDTEDSAAVLCRYRSGAAAVVSAAWQAGPAAWRATLVGSDGRVVIDPTTVETVKGPGSGTARPRPSEHELRLAVLDQFAETVRTRPAVYVGRAVDQLPALAVLEAAYLSARTHAPETPQRPYEMAGLPAPRAGVRAVVPPL